jgi:hypothetical protein
LWEVSLNLFLVPYFHFILLNLSHIWGELQSIVVALMPGPAESSGSFKAAAVFVELYIVLPGFKQQISLTKHEQVTR